MLSRFPWFGVVLNRKAFVMGLFGASAGYFEGGGELRIGSMVGII